MSGYITKEQCSKCNCIVKERNIGPGPGPGPEPNPDGDCTEVYRRLGSCLNQCLKEKCREYQRNRRGGGGGGSGRANNNCDW